MKEHWKILIRISFYFYWVQEWSCESNKCRSVHVIKHNYDLPCSSLSTISRSSTSSEKGKKNETLASLLVWACNVSRGHTVVDFNLMNHFDRRYKQAKIPMQLTKTLFGSSKNIVLVACSRLLSWARLSAPKNGHFFVPCF